MPLRTDFLPAGRLPRAQILGQARKMGDLSVLQAMLDSTPGMVALLNHERQIVVCNEACAKAGGLSSKDEVLGLRPGELLHCERSTDLPGGCGTSDACQYCGLAMAVLAGQQGKEHIGECLLRSHADEHEIPAEYAVMVRPMPQLGEGWLCCSLSDVSSEKRRQALEQTFFHDILNHAGAVEGVSNLLADDEMPSGERTDFVGMLSVSARALVDEIRSQRTLLAAERDELAIECTERSSLVALQESAATCLSYSVALGKQLVILPSAQSILFQTDSALLSRILSNLIKNALEASGANMMVTATCGMPAPGRVRFSIHNDTVMSDRVRAHVFQRSFSTKGSGRGLGTYCVKLLSESYLGGRAWFDSTPAEGTNFHVEFAI